MQHKLDCGTVEKEMPSVWNAQVEKRRCLLAPQRFSCVERHTWERTILFSLGY
jgi:hypothetical protein